MCFLLQPVDVVEFDRLLVLATSVMGLTDRRLDTQTQWVGEGNQLSGVGGDLQSHVSGGCHSSHKNTYSHVFPINAHPLPMAIEKHTLT